MTDIKQLLKHNRIRIQKGQKVETPTAWCLRYYTEEVYTDGPSMGKRKQKLVTLANKSDLYRSWADVQPLIDGVMADVNDGKELPSTPHDALWKFVEDRYLPWCVKNLAAPTSNSYAGMWQRYWKPHLGSVALTDVSTAMVTVILTELAKTLQSRTLSHIKWMLSGVYGFAIAKGIVPHNPVPPAQWLHRVARPKTQPEYSLEQVLSALRVLEPLNLQAAVAVALAYFAALRPAEIRGLQWADYVAGRLNIKRTVWRNRIGETKTEESSASVPVIEPLKSLLEKLRGQTPNGPQQHILQSVRGKPLSLDSLNMRVITPAMVAAGIDWHGYYPGRRGISSRVTDTSKNALNSTGLLRHSTPITALKHYTRAQKDSILAAMKTIEGQAEAIMAKEEEKTQ